MTEYLLPPLLLGSERFREIVRTIYTRAARFASCLRMQIETQRLILRDFKRSDWTAVHEYASDVDVTRYLDWGPNSVSQTKQFIDQAIEFQKQKPRQVYELAVVLRDDGVLIGGAGLTLVSRDRDQGCIGYCYNKKYWRCGYGFEACAALLEFGFTNFKLHRIFATCDALNVGSAALLSNCGMRREGHFIADKLIRGAWRDTLLFAILQEECQKAHHA